jgi:hypothetical protein
MITKEQFEQSLEAVDDWLAYYVILKNKKLIPDEYIQIIRDKFKPVRMRTKKGQFVISKDKLQNIAFDLICGKITFENLVIWD